MHPTRQLAITASIFFLMATGCSKKNPAQPAISTYTQAAVAAGGTLNSDGSVTNTNGTITEPNGQVLPGNGAQNQAANNAMAPASSAMGAPSGPPVPAPGSAMTAMTPEPAAPPPPAVLSVPAGTSVTIRTTQQLSASRNEVGDRFDAVLERPIVRHGETLFARGTPVAGTVVASKGKGRFKGAGALGIELTSIGGHRVETSEYEDVNKGRGKRTAGFIGGGAGVGALIGGLAGGGKGALIGGLAGAGGGTAASAYTGSRDVILRSETVITFTLRSSLTK